MKVLPLGVALGHNGQGHASARLLKSPFYSDVERGVLNSEIHAGDIAISSVLNWSVQLDAPFAIIFFYFNGSSPPPQLTV